MVGGLFLDIFGRYLSPSYSRISAGSFYRNINIENCRCDIFDVFQHQTLAYMVYLAHIWSVAHIYMHSTPRISSK
jgi:hypothetical protein